MIIDSRRISVALVAVSALLAATAGCSDSSKVKDARPLPTTAASGDLVCGFVSKDSVVFALGTTDFHASGEKRDAEGRNGRNPDGSTLSEAICKVFTAKVKGDTSINVSVEPLNVIEGVDSIVPSVLASGQAQYVFPAAEGQGFATSDQNITSRAAVCHLIVGDWHYSVSIAQPVEGRNTVDDAVAITRQIVAQLNLPKVGKLPRPTPTPPPTPIK